MRVMTAIHMATLFTYSTWNFHSKHDPQCFWILKETTFLSSKLLRKLQSLPFYVDFVMDSPWFCNVEGTAV